LRREYLYRKSLEGKEKEQYEKKRRIRKALEGMQTELRNCSLNISEYLQKEKQFQLNCEQMKQNSEGKWNWKMRKQKFQDHTWMMNMNLLQHKTQNYS